MFTGFMPPGANYGTFCGHWQVNAGDSLPPLQFLNCGQQVDVKNNSNVSSELSFFIKPENLCFCYICGLHFEDNTSFYDHCQQCYRTLVSCQNSCDNYGYHYDLGHGCGEERISDVAIVGVDFRNSEKSMIDNLIRDEHKLRPMDMLTDVYGGDKEKDRDNEKESNDKDYGQEQEQEQDKDKDGDKNKDNGSPKLFKTTKSKNKNKWQCEHCPLTFQYKKEKTKHEYLHTGDKPFACIYCGKKWKNKTALKRHVHTHTGEKPYECNWCEKRYTQSTLLKTHCQKTHGALVKFKKGKAVLVGRVDIQHEGEYNLLPPKLFEGMPGTFV